MVVKRFPHVLRFNSAVEVEAVRNEEGDWVVPNPDDPAITNVMCRAQPNGTEKKVTLVDGQKIDFAFLVFMPVGCPDITKGTLIELLNGDDKIFSGIVKHFHKSQINTRLWV